MQQQRTVAAGGSARAKGSTGHPRQGWQERCTWPIGQCNQGQQEVMVVSTGGVASTDDAASTGVVVSTGGAVGTGSVVSIGGSAITGSAVSSSLQC